MYKLFKLLHIIGLGLVLGSLATGIVLHFGAPSSGAGDILAGYEMAARAVSRLALPGLGLTGASGGLMMIMSRLSPRRQHWLALHLLVAAGFGVSTFALGVGALSPLLLVAAVVLGTVASAVGVVKPRWRK